MATMYPAAGGPARAPAACEGAGRVADWVVMRVCSLGVKACGWVVPGGRPCGAGRPPVVGLGSGGLGGAPGAEFAAVPVSPRALVALDAEGASLVVGGRLGDAS